VADHTAWVHLDRRRASSFGAVAAAYDRTRPTYPAALIDELLAEGARRVLDVGCGTGKAARLFLDRGCDVLGVEPDPGMAAIAREHGVTVEVSRFEDWDPRGRTFELVGSGQAWHWVDPEVGPAKAATVVEPGGRFGAFWNHYFYPPEVQKTVRPVYARLAPELADGSVAGATAAALGLGSVGGTSARRAALVATGVFTEDEILSFPWSRRYTTATWLEQLSTHSDHGTLPEERRRALLTALAEAFDGMDGGAIELPYVTTLVTARRRRAWPSRPGCGRAGSC
jgi:SAM-dependent methyltransferase